MAIKKYFSSKNTEQSYFSKRNKKLRVSKKTITSTVPKNALIELTNACNHACVFCYNPKMKRVKNFLNFDTYKNFILACVKEKVEEVGLYSTGDPFMAKNLLETIIFAKQNGIKRVYITTNGALATFEKVKRCIDAGLDSIKFSINAGSKKTYKIIHGFDDFEKVFKNIEDIYNYKVKNKIKLQLFSSYVYTNITYDEINDFKKNFSKFFEEMYFIKALNQGGRNVELSNKLNNKLEFENNNFEVNEEPCEMLWNRLHLTSEGNLTACCVDYENDLVYSKFDSKDSLYNLFNSPEIKTLRHRHLSKNLDGTICKDCIYNIKTDYKKLKNINTKETRLNENKIQSLKERIKSI